jgi:hypothetical protein
VRSFFELGSTNKPFSVPYAEIQGLFSAKFLKQNFLQIIGKERIKFVIIIYIRSPEAPMAE